jgi:hypothetical protein
MAYPRGSRTDLAIQIQKIESKQADSDLDVFHLDIFPLPATQLLEWHEFTRRLVYSDSFRIQDE